jgi:ferric-dicitrate binding protein FerR (iron transport regulator)
MAGADFPLENRRCERARQWSSLRLDGELSELEGALLEKHVETCDSCAAFDERLTATAISLRTAPPERPQMRFQVPQRTPVRFPAPRRLAVAAIAAALALGSLVGSLLHRPAPTPAPQGPQISLLTRDVIQLRQIPRGKHISPPAPARDPGEPSEGII